MRVFTELWDIRDRSKGYRVRAVQVIDDRGRAVMLEMSVTTECMDRYGAPVFQDNVQAELRDQLKKGAVGL